MCEDTKYHIPVLLKPAVDGLNVRPDASYVDVTFGGGGHSREILARMGERGRLFGFDQDLDAMQNVPNDDRFVFVRSNFRYLENFLRYHGQEKVDGILADLGVSSHHFDDRERGFSFRFDGLLDMRMNQKADCTASDIVNTYDEEQLADVLYLYGELKNARRLSKLIVNARQGRKITTVSQFLDCLQPIFNLERDKKDLARVFQALRIEVNHEMDALKEMLEASSRVLRTGGRLSIITYHSLEDRMVKNFMKTGNIEGRVNQDFYGRIIAPFKPLNGKVLVPSEEEISENPRSRSAKLRVAERIQE
ncbi:MAG: 16S rRNA (cytosine(1402)-N(4))-methyltransferase RsmH [Bacteroidales bacterium]|nr:16S rRNA (cytosine(1402)-N(4))-methyltransferase RsmH [Bacteroidales bacterium]